MTEEELHNYQQLQAQFWRLRDLVIDEILPHMAKDHEPKKITMIKLYRSATQEGLKESKDFVDGLIEKSLLV